jgi:Glycosyltransferase family 87
VRAALLPSLLLLVAGWALTLWVAPWSDERVNDLFVYRTFAEPFLSGGLPYRDIPFEYPPLSVPAIALPGVLGTGEESFRWAYAGWTLLAGAAVVVLCGALARTTGGDPRRAMLAAALMPLLCGALLRTHFDLFPVALLLGALLLVCRNRPRTGLAVLGLGAMTKAFPLVAVPIALAWLVAGGSRPEHAPARRRREAAHAAAACAAAIAVIAAGAVAISPGGAADAVSYHLERPAQIESSPALVLLALDAAGLGEATSVSSHRSDGVLHPASGAIASIFGAALVALASLLCMWGGRGRHELVLASLAAAVGFALFGKVLSPQFVIWVLPLGALAFAWRLHALAGAVAVAALLTQVEFPARYFDVVAREPGALALVAARNLVLLGVLVLAIRELQPRRHQQLLDGRRTALAVRLD